MFPKIDSHSNIPANFIRLRMLTRFNNVFTKISTNFQKLKFFQNFQKKIKK
jgi:hypothetical protein